MDKASIERAAKKLRRQIYNRRRDYWPDREPHPFEMLDPAIAANVLGIHFEYVARIAYAIEGEGAEVAGLIDRHRKTILVATRFGEEVARFTAAHEVGHWLMHPNERVMHRDTPIKGVEREVRDTIEQEADYFAAAFLMPDHFIRKIFRQMFLTTGQFVFDENTAYLLRPYDVPALLYPEKGSRIRERVLASCKSFNGNRFEKSLAEMFHVSLETMAIRIAELGLVRSWP